MENNNKQCIFKESFENEYLLCCGRTNLITCGRIGNDCNYIDSFDISVAGTNTDLDFIIYSSYISIFYYNNNYGSIGYYEYTIVLPSCVDKSYSIISFSYINDYLYNLIEKEMNTTYYITFTEIPTNYINLKINNEIIDINNMNKTILVDNRKKFEFISINERTGHNLKISNNISISETFTTQFFIILNILKCYKSCRKCTKIMNQIQKIIIVFQIVVIIFIIYLLIMIQIVLIVWKQNQIGI